MLYSTSVGLDVHARSISAGAAMPRGRRLEDGAALGRPLIPIPELHDDVRRAFEDK